MGKGDRLTDWRVRPLTSSQMAYAAADVDHLLALADAIGVELDGAGRGSGPMRSARRCAPGPTGRPTL